MSQKRIKQFQRLMAEDGVELTPDQSAMIYRMGSDFIRSSRKMSQVDLWDLLECEDDRFSEEEKEQLVELIQYAREPNQTGNCHSA